VGGPVGVGREKSKYFLCKNRIMKSIKLVFKKKRIRKNNRGSEFDQSTLYACAEISQ
jgi:hypothetical protein